MLPPSSLTPPLLGTPVRVNPFSLRQDLNGGRCKLLDTPSKSVISLTFTLPALRELCAPPHLPRGTSGMRVPPRRCQSLPCTPELSRTVALPRGLGEDGEENDEDVRVAVNKRGTGDGVEEDKRQKTGVSEKVDERLHMKRTENGELLQQEEGLGKESGPPVDLEMVSLERVEEEDEESACITEPMDCTKSPEPAEGVLDSTAGRPLLTSTSSSSSLQTNGWRLPISYRLPSLPPLPRLDNNNSSALVIGQQVQWGGGGRANVYSGAQVLASDPSGPSEQDEVVLCTGCCLVGLSFPSVCLRGSAAMPAPLRRASLPRQQPYRNLNSTITGGSTSPSTAATANKALLCRSTNGLVVPGPSVPCEPGRSLPEAQT